MSAAGVREGLVHRLRRNLVGPSEPEDADLADERLPAGESPSRWYLTGFIAPSGELSSPAAVPPADAEFEEGDSFFPEPEGFGAGGAAGDDDEPEPPAARRRYLPSSIGLSAMIEPGVDAIEATISWGDYVPEPPLPPEVLESGVEPKGTPLTWRRIPKHRTVTLRIPREDEGLVALLVPDSGASARPGGTLEIGVRARPFRLRLATGRSREVRVVTVFLVNKRLEPPSRFRDLSYAYQARIALGCEAGFLAQHDLSRIARDDWDDQLADLHYRDSAAYAVGLGCATGHEADADGAVRRVHTLHLPRAAVERTVAAHVEGVAFGMDRLAALARAGGEGLAAALAPLVADYARWSAGQQAAAEAEGEIADAPQRARTAAALVEAQEQARDRIAAGIALLGADDKARTAFEIANRAVADALRARAGNAALAPAWRPFQLAFILLNLAGLADQRHRRSRDSSTCCSSRPAAARRRPIWASPPSPSRSGVWRAAGLLGRRRERDDALHAAAADARPARARRRRGLRAGTDAHRSGLRGADGRACSATGRSRSACGSDRTPRPNRLGGKGDKSNDTAVARVRAFQSGRDSRAARPDQGLPMVRHRRSRQQSFRCTPHADTARPTWRLRCANPACAFTGDRPLPIVTVDEAIYRRLPAFLIATVDKFASLPWKGEAGAFFGHVDRARRHRLLRRGRAGGAAARSTAAEPGWTRPT